MLPLNLIQNPATRMGLLGSIVCLVSLVLPAIGRAQRAPLLPSLSPGYESPPAVPPACPNGGAVAGSHGIYLHSGELHLTAVDLRIPGRGLDFAWVRSYRSRLGPDTPQGRGWDFSYNLWIELGQDLVRLHDGNGRVDEYLLQPGGFYITRFAYDSLASSWRERGNLVERRRLPGTHSPVGDQDSLVESFSWKAGFGGPGLSFIEKWTHTDRNSTHYYYDAAGNLTSTAQAIPNVIDDFTYNSHGQLTSHTWPVGAIGSRRVDQFTYYEVPDPAAGYLRDITLDVNGEALTTSFAYDAAGNGTAMTDPLSNDSQTVFNELNQVVRKLSRQVTSEGTALRYRQDISYDANDNVVRVDTLNVDDQLAIPPNDLFTTTYEYDALNRLVGMSQEVDVGRNVVNEYEYDANGNRTLWRKGEAVAGG